MIVQHFILHDGPEERARDLILAAGLFAEEIHDEIWVFNQGFWYKDHNLWVEVQKADWKDVILDDGMILFYVDLTGYLNTFEQTSTNH
jgi:transitional endoplasmic reticulum ATPase